jgi:hypothetical protein
VLLQILNLQNCTLLQDISGLASCVHLSELDLARCRVSNIGPLQHLHKLEWLSLSQRPPPIRERESKVWQKVLVDITPLKHCGQLSYLDLTGNSALGSIDAICHLARLKSLAVGGWCSKRWPSLQAQSGSPSNTLNLACLCATSSTDAASAGSDDDADGKRCEFSLEELRVEGLHHAYLDRQTRHYLDVQTRHKAVCYPPLSVSLVNTESWLFACVRRHRTLKRLHLNNVVLSLPAATLPAIHFTAFEKSTTAFISTVGGYKENCLGGWCKKSKEAAEALALRVTFMVKDSAWARPDLELNLAGVTAAAIHPPEGGERTGRRALPARNA